MTKAARRTFQSLRYRNYRLFFGGQIVSQTGSWMQRIALGWYVLQLTHSPFDVGVMAFAQFAPYMVFGLFAGVLADRLDARRTVIGTQTALLISASALAWIALGGFAEPWMLYTIGFISGTVLVLDVPSRQQLTYRMVGREDLPNAIALNSTLFNASRIFGPAIAGIVLVAGAGVCFLTNAISYLAVLICLLLMRVSEFFPLERFERPKILAGTREGLVWIRKQPRMLVILSLVFVISTFCFNFNVTLPVLAKVTLNGHAYVYGLLSAAFGVGALVGALAAASLGRASMKVLLVGGMVFSASELLLAPVQSAVLAGVLLFFVGAGFTAWSANSNAIMQLAAPDHLRGRVIGLYFYAFNGTGAIAGILTGWLCAQGGTRARLRRLGPRRPRRGGRDGADARLDAADHDAPPRRAAAARLIRSRRTGEDTPSTVDRGGDQVSVIVTLRFTGDPDKLEQIAAEQGDMIRGISARAQEQGVIAHRFYASGDQIMVVDEWPDEQSFTDVLRVGAGEHRPADGAGRDERAGAHLLAEARDRRRRRLGVAALADDPGFA